MPRSFRLLALASLVIAGCHAEVQTKANVSASAGEDEHKWETGQQETWNAPPGVKPAAPAAPAAAPSAAADTTPGRAPFIGVTPDLTLAPTDHRTPSCMCLAVGFGQPGDSAFRWQGGVPGADEGTMAVAISGDGVPCDWKPKGKGRAKKQESEPLIPSIAAVESSGNDVVVTVEAAHLGRPIAHGAMIQRPGPGGALVVRGRGRVPFGRPADGGKGTCRIAVAK